MLVMIDIFVFQEVKNFSAQIIDDVNNKLYYQHLQLKKILKAPKAIKCQFLKYGWKIAKVIDKNIKKIYFDRGKSKYHGRVKNLQKH